ncbi:MAG TPA: carbamoyltransferase N-terminal domain-containing protein [Vicinamibacterales bacterium]|nr:carbamoyltransferase N-terminal domain-containing protein [Vicinamibacterales bacterium]
MAADRRRWLPRRCKPAILTRPSMHILGISCYFHDAAAAILCDGQLVAAAEEERFTRKKHDYDFPQHAIDFCLEAAGIQSTDLDYVAFFEKPFVKFERLLLTTLQQFPRSSAVFREAMIAWLGDKLWIKNLIRKRLGVPESRILFSQHHLSHAASAFLCSPFEEAAILTIDGVGEWATATRGIGKGNTVRIADEIRFPHSLGLLYSAFTAFLGFEVNDGEYKVMGMAPFGEPRYVDEVYKLVRVAADGSFELDLDYFLFQRSTERTFSSKFISLFGPPRDCRSRFFTQSTPYPSYFGDPPANFAELARQNQHYADIAASIQFVTEETLLKMARHLQRQTGLKQLCLAGGVALNSVANAKLLKETPFEDIYVQPAAGDGGGALGAALVAEHMVLGRPRRFVMEHAYWGQDHGPDAVHTFLRHNNIAYEQIEYTESMIERVVAHLRAGKVVGWFDGRFEWGPRALGRRSILADPRRPDMKDIVNVKIKFREPFRPFAPSILAERAEEYFDLADAAKHYPARFMLYVVDVHEGKQDLVPAITHVDGTGRLQAVHYHLSPTYYELIETFGQATGVPMVLNTSFNLKGEPIVNTPAEAFSTFVRSGLDILVLGECLIEKPVESGVATGRDTYAVHR